MPSRLSPALLLLLLAGCGAASQRAETERAAVRKEVAGEIARICALPESERRAQIEAVKAESGLAISCPSP